MRQMSQWPTTNRSAKCGCWLADHHIAQSNVVLLARYSTPNPHQQPANGGLIVSDQDPAARLRGRRKWAAGNQQCLLCQGSSRSNRSGASQFPNPPTHLTAAFPAARAIQVVSQKLLLRRKLKQILKFEALSDPIDSIQQIKGRPVSCRATGMTMEAKPTVAVSVE